MPKTNQHRDDILFDSFNYFMKLWGNGKEAFFNVRCTNGRAWMSFNTFLGSQESNLENNFVAGNSTPRKYKHIKPKSSPSKRRRNQARAEAYRERKRQEAESSTVENNVNDTLATVDSGVEKSAIPNNCQDLFDKSNVVVDDHGHRGRTSTEAECSHFDPSLPPTLIIWSYPYTYG